MLDTLKDKVVLSDEISKFLELKKKGELYWARCPFHGEKTPSFVINNQKKFYYCFGCGARGDIFTFYKEYVKKDFKETLKILGDIYGIKIISKKNQNELDTIQNALEEALKHYRENLYNNKEAMQYLLEKRNLDLETIEKFQLGYANESKVITHLVTKGFSMDIIKKTSLNSYGSLDRFRNRIIFPIFSKGNNLIAFGGRVLDNSDPKYLNSSETELFQKNLHLYNENNIEINHPAILVEGYMDVIALSQQKIPNVLASMGTSLTPGQVLSIFKSTDSLYLMFDGDKSGQLSIERNINVCLKILTPGKNVFVCELPKDMDPDEVIKNPKKGSISELINKASIIGDWIFNRIVSEFKGTPEALAQIFEKIDIFLQNIQNKNVRKAYKLFFDNKIELFKKNIQITKSPTKTIDSEDVLINILLKSPETIEYIIEDLMMLQLSDKTYEKMRQDLIDKVTIEGNTSLEAIEYIKEKYSKSIKNLLNQKHFSYIIQNRGFVLQYLRDTICIIKRSSTNSLE